MEGRDETPEPTGAVRARVAALVADVLPSLEPVPPRLRKIADFAPARRARLGGEAILAAVLDDDDLRARVARLLETPDDGAAPGSEGPADRAARAWLVRAPGWREEWTAAGDHLAAEAEVARVAQTHDDVRRAAERADRAEGALVAARAEHRRRVDELGAEVATLRRRLGETRARERQARRDAEEAAAALESDRRAAREAAAEADAERRRLRVRATELEAANTALRRAGRQERGEADLRVRVLLDAVVEAATGLRRELTLPPADGYPAQRVERLVAERAVEPTAPAGRGAEAPAALEQHLAVPRARLLVDGYNVSKTAWPEASLEDQRARLLRSLAPLVARTGAETTVVFDAAAAAAARSATAAPRGVRVLFSPPGVIADEVIAELVEAEPPGRTVVVVSSDAEVAAHAARHAARPVASDTLLAILG